MARLIATNGTTRELGEVTFEQLQELVGGNVEFLPLCDEDDGAHLAGNENLPEDAPRNPLATMMVSAFYKQHYVVRGPQVLVDRRRGKQTF